MKVSGIAFYHDCRLIRRRYNGATTPTDKTMVNREIGECRFFREWILIKGDGRKCRRCVQGFIVELQLRVW